jgi:hypothetical protein
MDFLKDFAVPMLLLAVGIIGKSLIRGKSDLDSWFMGPDLALVGIGSDIGHAIDFAGLFFADNNASVTVLRGTGKDLALTSAYAFIAAFAYLVVLKIHQAYDPNQHPTPRERKFWLGGLCNFVGVTTFAALFFLLRRM